MKWVETILHHLLRYLADFGSLVTGPKRFIAQKNTRAEDTFGESLIFLGISLGLGLFLTVSLNLFWGDFWLHTLLHIVTDLLFVSLCAIALRLAWRLVGGKASVRSFFVTYAYFAGTMIVIFYVISLLGEGVFLVFAPDLHYPFFTEEIEVAFEQSSIFIVAVIIIGGGMLLLFLWSILAWGAYRVLNGLSKWRSLVAFTIMVPIIWGGSKAIFYVHDTHLKLQIAAPICC